MLAGTEPESEIVLLRDYLGWPSDKAWIVDSSKRNEVRQALDRARKFWPGANVENTTLLNVLPRLDTIGFVNLDLMGAPLQKETMICFEQIVPKLPPKAVVGFTWIRGRENIQGNPSARLLWELGKGYEGNQRRWAGVLRFIDTISDGTLHLIDRCEYHNNKSPMAVAIFRKESSAARRSVLERWLSDSSPHQEVVRGALPSALPDWSSYGDLASALASRSPDLRTDLPSRHRTSRS